MELKPILDRIVVQPDPKPKHASGLYIPDLPSEKSDKGQVLAAGPQCKFIKAGDKVLFTKFTGQEVKVDGVTVLIMNEDAVMARLME